MSNVAWTKRKGTYRLKYSWGEISLDQCLTLTQVESLAVAAGFEELPESTGSGFNDTCLDAVRRNNESSLEDIRELGDYSNFMVAEKDSNFGTYDARIGEGNDREWVFSWIDDGEIKTRCWGSREACARHATGGKS